MCDRPTLTVVTGAQVGKVFMLDHDETLIGRSRECQIYLEDLSVSRKHARVLRSGEEYTLVDAGSRHGTTVHGLGIDRHRLVDGDRIGVGPAIFFRFAFADETEQKLLRQLYESSILDGLTGAVNRRHFSERLASEIAYATRHKVPLSLLLLDVDRFKDINDRFGHQAGDHALRTLGAKVKGTLRTEDIFARYGGEEFAVIARGIELGRAFLLAERLRSMVHKANVDYAGATMHLTVSIGVASLSCIGPNPTAEKLVGIADARLYAAKSAGRNRVVAK